MRSGRKEGRRLDRVDNKQRALLLEGDVRDAAAGASLLLKVSVMTSGRSGCERETPHWQFNDSEGVRVLDYWPGNGTWRDPETGRKGKASDPWEALEVAKRLAVDTSAAVLPSAPSQGSLFGR
jgi:hypothetical protein